MLFQDDSVLVRSKCFGCSSRTEPAVDEDSGQHALLLSADPLSSLPQAVRSGSGRNTEPNTYVSATRSVSATAEPSAGGRIYQLVARQGNPSHLLPHFQLPVGSVLFSNKAFWRFITEVAISVKLGLRILISRKSPFHDN